MRWLLTLLLAAMVAGAAAWLIVGDKPTAAVGPSAATATATLESLRPDAVTKLELTSGGRPSVVLTKNADGTWTQPGNWPVRDADVNALVAALTGLRSRFQPLPLDSADVAKYGLAADQKPATAVLHVGNKTVTLKFGRPDAPNEPEFGRPCYVRVDDAPEVLRLGPDVFPLVAKSPDAYRRRQLFPDVLRVKLGGGDMSSTAAALQSAGRTAVLGDAYASVAVDKPGESFVLKRTATTPTPRRDPDRSAAEPTLSPTELATAWEINFSRDKTAIRDRVEPAKLRAALTAIPDLWVEKFVDLSPEAAGLDKPYAKVTVTRTGGAPVVLQVGNVSRVVEAPPPPIDPFSPPPPPKPGETFRYAKLADNPLVFEIRADKLADLIADPESLRDPSLARFEPANVTELAIAMKSKPPIKLLRKKGNKNADKEDDRKDRWFVGDLLADEAKVTELIDALAKLDAKGKENLVDAPDAAKLKELALDPADATRVFVLVQPRVADGESHVPARTIEYLVGKDDPATKKLAVQVAGWPRANLVDDAVAKLIDRPALAYRGRRLFDTAEAKLESLAVIANPGDGFALRGTPKAAPAVGLDWKLTKPVATDADPAKADQMANDLSRLEVSEYVDDAPKPEDLDAKYGLAKPRFAVDLGFTGPGAKPMKLEIGNAVAGKPEVYARLNGTGSVFAIPKSVVDEIAGGSLALLPLQIWSVPTDKIASIEIRRGDGGTDNVYRIARDGGDWKLTGPFDAAVGFPEVQPLLAAIATVKAEKFESHAVADPSKYGFDKPTLRLAVTMIEAKPTTPGQPPAEQTVTKTLILGKPTAEGAGTRFARLDGPNAAAFVLPDALLLAADKPALGWLDRTLYSVPADTVTKIQIAGPTQDSNATLTKDDKGNWKAEGAAFAVDGPTVDALLFAASRPPVARLAAYGAAVNLAQYGLDNPSHAITVTAGGTTHVLKLGKKDNKGERFVSADDKPAIGVLLPRAADALAKAKLDFVDRTLLAFDPTSLTEFRRTAGKDELDVVQAGIGWEIAKPAKQKADVPTMEDLADQLGRLRATRVAAFAPNDAELDKLGLKNPAATIALKVGGDKPEERVLKLGKPVDDKKPDGDRYALAVPTDAKTPSVVGVIPAELATRLLAEPIKFRDKGLAKFVDADKIALARGDRKVAFAKVDGTWKVTDPDAFPAEQADLDDLVNAAAKLRADELAEDKPKDMKPFGLDAPEAVWTFSTGDREVLKLLVGAKDKDGKRAYAKLDKGDAVVLLDPTTTAKLLGEYRKRDAWKDVDASQIAGLAISSGTSQFSLQNSPMGWGDRSQDRFDSSAVNETAAALAGLKAERFVADKDAKLDLYGLAKPRRVIVVTQRGQPPKILQIGGDVGGTGGKQVYARVEEPGRGDVFVLSESDTAKLMRDRAAYLLKK